MAESPQITLREPAERPDAAMLAPFRDAPTGWIVDAQERRGALPHWIRPLTAATRAVGTALTVRSRGRDNLAPYVALRFARPGDVLVIQTDAYSEASVLGDILLGMARNAGIVAAVTDGMARDIDGLNAVGIPLFAQGLSPNSPFKDGPGEIGGQVNLGGVTVACGDLVVTDKDGVVVVPQAALAAVATGLAEVAAKEAAMDAAVRGGAPWPEWVDAFVKGPKFRRIG
jgi:4-hydroxy-4-methyl-2-oxoglutarate aldolase